MVCGNMSSGSELPALPLARDEQPEVVRCSVGSYLKIQRSFHLYSG